MIPERKLNLLGKMQKIKHHKWGVINVSVYGSIGKCWLAYRFVKNGGPFDHLVAFNESQILPASEVP